VFKLIKIKNFIILDLTLAEFVSKVIYSAVLNTSYGITKLLKNATENGVTPLLNIAIAEPSSSNGSQ